VLYYQPLRTGIHSRRRRGVTLITTVLLSALAATIAIVIVRQTTLVTGADSGTVANLVLGRGVDNLRLQFEQELREDPQFYLTRTFANERPRKCFASTPETIAGKWLIPVTGTLVSQQWPAECGKVWEYPGANAETAVAGAGTFTNAGSLTAGGTWYPQNNTLRAEIIPPNADSGVLTFRALAAGGAEEDGLVATYTRNAASGWTLYSAQSLPMSRLGGGNELGANARVYSGGPLTTQADTFASDTLLASETSISGGGSSSAELRAIPNPSGSGWANIRNTVPQPLTISELRSSLASIPQAACGGNVSTNLTQAAVLRAPRVCLRPGESLINTEGNSVPVPADVASWLLVLTSNETTAPVIDVYYAVKSTSFITECNIICDLASISEGIETLGNDPGATPGGLASPWKKLASTYFPASGVLWSERDVFLSHPQATSTSGASITIASAGDVYLSGPLKATGENTVGVVAGKNVLIPYFAAAGTSDVQVTASVAALGSGSDDASVRAVPDVRVRQGSQLGSFTLTGSLATNTVGHFAGVESFTLTTDPRLTLNSPPLFASFGTGWKNRDVKNLSSSELCGNEMVAAGTDTCVGLW
jgi:hypothetical protein